MPVLPLVSKMYKVWLRYLEVLKQQEILNAVKEGTVVNFRGHKAQTKVRLVHSQVKTYERNFDS